VAQLARYLQGWGWAWGRKNDPPAAEGATIRPSGPQQAWASTIAQPTSSLFYSSLFYSTPLSSGHGLLTPDIARISITRPLHTTRAAPRLLAPWVFCPFSLRASRWWRHGLHDCL